MHLVMDIFVKGSGLVDCGVWGHGRVLGVRGRVQALRVGFRD